MITDTHMKKIKQALVKLTKNIYAVALVALIICLLNAYLLYRNNYHEPYSVSYSSGRLTIHLANNGYLESYRLHDYWVDDNGQVLNLANEKDDFTVNLKSENFSGNITEVSERVEGENATIESYLTKTETGVRLTRLITSTRKVDFSTLDRVYMQMSLGGSEFTYSEKDQKLQTNSCTITFKHDIQTRMRFQVEDQIITIYKDVTSQIEEPETYNFSFDINIDCGAN